LQNWQSQKPLVNLAALQLVLQCERKTSCRRAFAEAEKSDSEVAKAAARAQARRTKTLRKVTSEFALSTTKRRAQNGLSKQRRSYQPGASGRAQLEGRIGEERGSGDTSSCDGSGSEAIDSDAHSNEGGDPSCDDYLTKGWSVEIPELRLHNGAALVIPHFAFNRFFLFQLLHPKAVAEASMPLSADGFTLWGRDNADEHNRELLEATTKLRTVKVKQVAEILGKKVAARVRWFRACDLAGLRRSEEAHDSSPHDPSVERGPGYAKNKDTEVSRLQVQQLTQIHTQLLTALALSALGSWILTTCALGLNTVQDRTRS
jgi:hypothetical protein